MSKYKIIDTTDGVTECDCCGKTGLKFTYIMKNETGDCFYFGAVCGAKHNDWSVSELKEQTKKAKNLNSLTQMISEAKTEHQKNKIIAFVQKSNLLSLDTFFSTYGLLSEWASSENYKAYQYGSKMHLINN